MPYITIEEAEANVPGFAVKDPEEKNSLIFKAEVYISNKCVPEFKDVTKVPVRIKQAVYEAIKGIEAGGLISGQTQVVTSKRVKADTVEVQKTFAEGSIEKNATEQYIDMLIDPYANCANSGFSFALNVRL